MIEFKTSITSLPWNYALWLSVTTNQSSSSSSCSSSNSSSSYSVLKFDVATSNQGLCDSKPSPIGRARLCLTQRRFTLINISWLDQFPRKLVWFTFRFLKKVWVEFFRWNRYDVHDEVSYSASLLIKMFLNKVFSSFCSRTTYK